jgi:hypothetical protein
MPKLWLPPKVWFHGSQSTSTGGASASTGMLWAICCWLAHHMPWVLITALGSLVEPLVNRNLAMVSGPVACMAASTAGVVRGQQVGKGRAGATGHSPAVSTTSRSVPTTAPIARP